MSRRFLHAGLAFGLALSLMAFGHASSTRAAEDGLESAIFAGGCFWCVESDFDKVPGVARTISGYTGGTLKDPTYKDVTAGGSGHLEAVKIDFDPKKVTYERLLYVFWRSVDPTDAGGQFCDRGESYMTAIFATSEKQRGLAEASKKKLQASGVLSQPVVTPIRTAGAFYPAEDYHQDYYKKSSLRYKFYRYSCGRDKRVKNLWGDQAHGGIPHS